MVEEESVGTSNDLLTSLKQQSSPGRSSNSNSVCEVPDLAKRALASNFRPVGQFLGQRQVQSMQCLSRLFYDSVVPKVFNTIKVSFQMENIFTRPIMI